MKLDLPIRKNENEIKCDQPNNYQGMKSQTGKIIGTRKQNRRKNITENSKNKYKHFSNKNVTLWIKILIKRQIISD